MVVTLYAVNREKSERFGVKRVKLRVCLVCSAGSGECKETLKKSMLLALVVQRKECMFLMILQTTSGTLISARWSEPCQNRSFLLV